MAKLASIIVNNDYFSPSSFISWFFCGICWHFCVV